MRPWLTRAAVAVTAGALAVLAPASALADEAQSVQVTGTEGRDISFLVYLDPDVEVAPTTPLTSKVVIGGTEIPSTASVQSLGVDSTQSVMVFDTSGSMRGEQLASAKKAATSFVQSIPSAVEVGLVTFNDQVEVAVEPTTNRPQVIDAIDGLTAGGKTALFDGILAGLDQADPAKGARLLVLSDGGDTASAATLAEVNERAQTAGVPIDVIALSPNVNHADVLKGIASESGGQFLLSTGASGLAGAFSQATGSFGTKVNVLATVPPGVNASATFAVVNVAANDVTYTGTVKTPRSSDLEGSGSAAPVPTQEAVVPVVPVPPSSGADSLPALLGILAALIVAILVLSYISYRRRERQYLRTQQVLWYTTAQGTGAPKPDFAQHGIITAFDDWLSKRKSYPETEAKLDTAGMAMSPGMWLLIRWGVMLVLGLIIAILIGNVLVGILIGLAIGWLGTRAWVNSRANSRRKAFENELPDFLMLIASALRSGLSFLQALDSTATDGQGEVSRQIRRATREVQMGSTIEMALTRVADRMESDDLRWTVTAVAIQREVGGNLSNVLDTAAATVRSRAELRREVRTLSAEGKLSGWVLAALPVGLFLYMLLANRAYVAWFWTETAGVVALVFIGIIFTAGFLWMRRIVRIEV